MSGRPVISNLYHPWRIWVAGAIGLLWLLTVFLVPIVFTTPGVMANGFDVSKVTLYRSLVGLMCALWTIDGSLTPSHL